MVIYALQASGQRRRKTAAVASLLRLKDKSGVVEEKPVGKRHEAICSRARRQPRICPPLRRRRLCRDRSAGADRSMDGGDDRTGGKAAHGLELVERLPHGR